ncbi:transglutaminase family protein [Phenylobacterium sp. LjRoot225]|uniref:transglutaminase-like domain-containing protein n=1 Tax=Phenylobacterium sp. LjRoot225 TaxID=3342285 RepID=UPI003ECED477
MRFSVSADLTYQFATPCEVLLLLEAANGGDQRVSRESLIISDNAHITRLDDAETGERRAAFLAADTVQIQYQAEIDVAERDCALTGAPGVAIDHLPPEALRHLRPSRYCPSDRFERFVNREFSDTAGGDRVEAILAWVAEHLDYVAGVSDAATTSLDTFVDRAGVCRDFTHLTISLCRASQIPARAVSAYGWELDPPDMHAVVEVFVGDKWRLVDPTGKVRPEGLVRVATGRDAADIAFMSIFGQAQLVTQSFTIAQAA